MYSYTQLPITEDDLHKIQPIHLLWNMWPGGRFGAVVSVIGDINKDGLDDLAVGAPSDLSPDAGRVYIYLGAKKGFTTFSKPVQVGKS